MRPFPSADVFTLDEALATGWTVSALRHAVHSGLLSRPRRGVYAVGPAGERHRVLAAARAYPQAVLSHRSALLLYGLPLVGRRPPAPEVTVPPRSNGNLVGVHVHRAQLRAPDVVLVDDARVTAVARTLVDVARHVPATTAVAALDAALHRGLVSMRELESTMRFCWNWPGIRRAERAVMLADPRAESPLESISRLTLRRLRLPEPRTQRLIFDARGTVVGRGDFYWDEFGVIGEADGRAKYADRDVLTAEKEHQEEYEDLGLVVVRWGWDYVTRRPQALRARIEAGFERGRARDRSGFPRLWSL